MKKLVFVFLATVFISCSQAQNDFHGKWLNEDDGYKMEYSITAKTLSSTYTPRNPSLIAPIERNTYEIFSWEKMANEDADSKTDYPSGFLIGLRSGTGNTTLTLFIHKNKNSLISVYEYRGAYRKDVYIKQGNTNISSSNQQKSSTTPEYELCQAVLENKTAMAQEAIKHIADINNLWLKDTEARNFRRTSMNWFIDKFPEEGMTREDVDRFFSNPPRSIDLDNVNVSEDPSTLLMIAIGNDNVDMVRILLKAGIKVSKEDLERMASDTHTNSTIKALLLEAIRTQS